MTGIANAQEHADTLRRPDKCPQCGIEEGDRHPDTGKLVACMRVAQAVPGIGVVCWCSHTCREAWIGGWA